MSHSSRPLLNLASRPVLNLAAAALLTGGAAVVAGCGGGDEASKSTTPTALKRSPALAMGPVPEGEPGKVVRAVDGDTVIIEIDGKRTRVRLLGIDAPESNTKRTGSVQCGGEMAKGAMRNLVDRYDTVSVATDPGQDKTDKFGRLLAYVTPTNGYDPTWGQQLIAAGWATLYEQPGKPIVMDKQFRLAAAAAKDAEAGVWAVCGGDFKKSE